MPTSGSARNSPRETKQAIAEGLADAYEMPRLSTFCGRPMRHSGWYPDYVLRLFRRGSARFSDDLVHERVICEGIVARLKEPLTIIRSSGWKIRCRAWIAIPPRARR